MDTATMIGKGRKNLTCLYIKCIRLIKYIFIADILFLGGHLRFGKIHFPLADTFYFGGHLRLQSSCIPVNMVVPSVLSGS